MKPLKIFNSSQAPAAIGPYSQAVSDGHFVYLSGQLGVNPENGQLAPSIEGQTEQIFKNIKAVLQACNLELKDVIKATVFMKDLGQFQTMNQIYEQAFQGHKPARSTVEVSKLPREAMIEIEVIAVVN